MENFDDLLDRNLDDLKDMPAFVVPPVGHYKLSVSFARKTVNDKPCMEGKFKVMETLELKNPEDAAVEEGTEFTCLYQLTNEFGEGAFKEILKPIAAGTGITSVREIVDPSNSYEIYATLKHRVDKNDKEKIYANLQNITFA